jgi:hypothetical protein
MSVSSRHRSLENRAIYPIFPVSNPKSDPAIQALTVAKRSRRLNTPSGMALTSALVRSLRNDMMKTVLIEALEIEDILP